MSDWQPIDTAPRDGTQIDVWCKRSWEAPVTHERRTNVYWCTAHQCWRTVGNEHFVEIGFRGLGHVRNRYVTPTHWMPLPEPPKI